MFEEHGVEIAKLSEAAKLCGVGGMADATDCKPVYKSSILLRRSKYASLVEQVDTADLNPAALKRREGSTPSRRTNKHEWWNGLHSGLRSRPRKGCEFESRLVYQIGPLAERQTRQLQKLFSGNRSEGSKPSEATIYRMVV